MMLGFTDVLLLLSVIIAGVFLFRHRRMHEKADGLARHYCKRNGLQFLDGTVSSSGISLNWKKLHVCRSFRFDYSLDNIDRHFGMVTLCGEHMQAFRVNPEHMKAIESEPGSSSTANLIN